MLKGFMLVAVLILLSTLDATAQSARPSVKPPETKPSDSFPTDDQKEVSLPEEMRVKMAIARAEGEHKKILEDVEKLGDLSNEIAKGYSGRDRLSSEQIKKLGTIEKLARRVLTHAGGDEVSDKSGTTEHMTVSDAVGKLNTAAENIRKDMKSETRFVVSASVIANCNEVINLARFIRRAQKAD